MSAGGEGGAWEGRVWEERVGLGRGGWGLGGEVRPGRQRVWGAVSWVSAGGVLGGKMCVMVRGAHLRAKMF